MTNNGMIPMLLGQKLNGSGFYCLHILLILMLLMSLFEMSGFVRILPWGI
jgi:hypothetical protein